MNKKDKTLTDIHYTDTIHYELEQTAKLMRMLTHQLFEKLGIDMSFEECTALDVISTNKGICQRDLAKKIIKDRANTGRIILSLERKGLIKRFMDLKNNRIVKKIEINSKGKIILENIQKKIKSHLESVTLTIPSEELDKIRNILKVFRLNLEKVVEMNI